MPATCRHCHTPILSTIKSRDGYHYPKCWRIHHYGLPKPKRKRTRRVPKGTAHNNHIKTSMNFPPDLWAELREAYQTMPHSCRSFTSYLRWLVEEGLRKYPSQLELFPEAR